jgi:hypothetical protein
MNEELTLGIADWWLYGIIEMVLVVDAISRSVFIKRLLWWGNLPRRPAIYPALSGVSRVRRVNM